MTSRKWLLALVTVIVTLMPGSLFAIGNCPPDINGQVYCRKQCGVNHACYDVLNREYYCYQYIIPAGCWHDGTYEPCCAPRQSF